MPVRLRSLSCLAVFVSLCACDCGPDEPASDEDLPEEVVRIPETPSAVEVAPPTTPSEIAALARARTPIYQRPLTRPLMDVQHVPDGRFVLLSEVAEVAIVDAELHVYASERLAARRQRNALIAADGHLVLVAPGGPTVLAWHLTTRRWQVISTIHVGRNPLARADAPIRALALREDRIAVHTDDGLCVGTVSEGLGEPAEVPHASSIALSFDGEHVYGFSDESAWVRPFEGGEVVAVETGASHLAVPSAFEEVGTLVVSASEQTLTMHAAPTLEPRLTTDVGFSIRDLCSSFDAAYVFAGGFSNESAIVDASTGELVDEATLSDEQRDPATRVGCAKTYLRAQGAERLLGGERSLWGAAIAPDASSVVSYGRGSWVQWSKGDANTERCDGLSTPRYLSGPNTWAGLATNDVCIPGQEPRSVRALFWSDDGRRMVGLVRREVTTLPAGTFGLGSLGGLSSGRIPPIDGQTTQLAVVSLAGEGDDVLWSQSRLNGPGCTLERHCDRLMDLSLDGEHIVTPVGDELQVLDATLETIARFALDGAVRAGFSHDAARIAVVSGEGVRMHDASDGSQSWQAEWDDEDGESRSMRFAFSPDDLLLAAIRQDALYLFDVASGESRGRLDLDRDGTTRFWWAGPQRLMRVTNNTLVVHDAQAQVVSTQEHVLGVSDDGARIATCDGGVMHVHHFEESQDMASECFSHDAALFSADGSRVVLARRAYALMCRTDDGACLELHRFGRGTSDLDDESANVYMAADGDGRFWTEPVAASEFFMRTGEVYGSPLEPLTPPTPGLLQEFVIEGS